MTLRLVVRILAARPVRTLVLAGGFGFGIAVMAALLGVGQVILEQARSPELRGGGHLRITGAAGEIPAARHLLGGVLRSEPFAGAVEVAAPSRRETLWLVGDGEPARVAATGGVPSRERALGDPEVPPGWRDVPADGAWADPSPEDVLRSLDRFHRIPETDGPWADSWAEWLYFNGRSEAGDFYLTFLVAGPDEAGRRPAGVRLQWREGEETTSWVAGEELDTGEILRRAPELEIAGNRIVLEGRSYHLHLELEEEESGVGLEGDLVLEAPSGVSVPPLVLRGRRGWVSGYVVPVLSGPLRGRLRFGDRTVELGEARGYHDHNWGFWQDVTWQWGETAHEDLSLVYGRVEPPAEAADPRRVPALLALLGPEGPLGFARDLEITQRGKGDAPASIELEARGDDLRLRATLEVLETVRTPLGAGDGAGPFAQTGGPVDFLQMKVLYTVEGRAGQRPVEFRAPGSAETFRPRRSGSSKPRPPDAAPPAPR